MEKIIQILLYVGAIQGFMLAIGLNAIRVNKNSNRILGILSGLWGLILLIFALKAEGLYIKYPHLLLVFDQLLFLIFPLFYLHAKYLLSSRQKYKHSDLWHFLPFALSIVASFSFFIEAGEDKQFLLDNPSPYMAVVEIISNEVIGLQSLFYSILTLRLVRNYKRRIKDYQSTSIRTRIHLIEIGALVILVAWSASIIGLHLDFFGVDLGFDYFLVSYLSLVFVIYFTSYASFRSVEVFKIELESPNVSNKLIPKDSVSKIDFKTEIDVKNQRKNTETIGLENERNEALNKALVDYMEKEKPYLNSDLNLIDLAKDLSMTRNDLSSVINSCHHVNFYEFVNKYRVEEVKMLMKDPSSKNLDMMGYGYAAGFNSKASYYRVFKQFTNMSPSEYLKSISS
jgi:AraC-like DNA-binding protein